MQCCSGELSKVESEVWYGSLSMMSFDDIQFLLRCDWCVLLFTLKDDFDQSYNNLHFWSEVYVGSLYWTFFKTATTFCTYVIRPIALYQLLDIVWWMRLSSMVVMYGKAHSIWLITFSLDLLHLRVMCVASHSTLKIESDASITAVTWGVL